MGLLGWWWVSSGLVRLVEDSRCHGEYFNHWCLQLLLLLNSEVGVALSVVT